MSRHHQSMARELEVVRIALADAGRVHERWLMARDAAIMAALADGWRPADINDALGIPRGSGSAILRARRRWRTMPQ